MPALISSRPNPRPWQTCVRQLRVEATLPVMNARKKVCEAQPYLRTHPAAPDDPTVLGPRLKGHGVLVRVPVANP
jgi:hypothetical protein